MRNTALLLAVLCMMACGNKTRSIPKDQLTEDSISENTTNTDKEDEAYHSPVPAADGFTWNEAPLKKELSADEKAWVGSVVAENVDGRHINTGGVMFVNTSPDKKGMDGMIDAIENDQQVKDRCIWLELYEDHKGFWFSCMMFNGSAQTTDKMDITTGEPVTMGVMFDWYIDNKELKIRFEEPLQFTWTKDTTRHELRTRYWSIRIPGRPADNFKATDHFPEYDYTLPFKTGYQFYKKQINGRPVKYETGIMIGK